MSDALGLYNDDKQQRDVEFWDVPARLKAHMDRHRNIKYLKERYLWICCCLPVTEQSILLLKRWIRDHIPMRYRVFEMLMIRRDRLPPSLLLSPPNSHLVRKNSLYFHSSFSSSSTTTTISLTFRFF